MLQFVLFYIVNKFSDRQQTMLVYFAWSSKGPGGHQLSWPWVSHYAHSAVTAAIHKAQTQL